MADRSVARRYATAFMELADDSDQIDVLSEDLDKVVAEVQQHDGLLYRSLSSPIFTLDERRRVLDAVLPRFDVRPLTTNLLRLLLDKQRFDTLPGIADEYRKLADERSGRARVTVETAEPLTPQLEAEVRAALEAATGKTVILETAVKPELIGGLVARVGSRVFDASIRTRLAELRRKLLSTRPSAEA